MRGKVIVGCLALIAALAVSATYALRSPTMTDAEFVSMYDTPLSAPVKPLVVYHLGHSLVGRDMPAMLAQMVQGHDYASQLGWGASMMNHWTGDVPGFDHENANPNFEPAGAAIDSGRFDAFVLTEMVEIKDAITYHDSAEYLARWSARARAANPDVRIYLYESWHPLDDPDGWLKRLDGDLAQYWEGAILRPAMAAKGTGAIYVIPGGQVMAAFVREIDAGNVPGMARREDLFSTNDDGSQDNVHLNDAGAYLIALTHYAVLYGKSPVGLPSSLTRADGTPADAPSPDVAQIMQEVVWKIVTSYGPTGVGPKPAS